MPIAVYVALSVVAICGLTWVFGRVLYPIPIRFEGASDERHPEVDARLDQRFRQADGQ